MKKIILYLILLIAVVLFNGCGTVEPIKNDNISILEGISLLDTVNTKFRELAAKPGNGPIKSLQETKDWLIKLPNVRGASILDNFYMIIELKTGMSVTFNLYQVDSEGYSVYRGGGGDEAKTLRLDKFDQLQKRKNSLLN